MQTWLAKKFRNEPTLRTHKLKAATQDSDLKDEPRPLQFLH